MADAGYNMDGFGAGMRTPDGRRSAIRSRLEMGALGNPEYNGPYIDPGMSDQEVADRLRGFYYENSGAWANEGQRSEARKEYALENPNASGPEVRKRLADSVDLLDPITRQNKQHLADSRFLEAYRVVDDAKAEANKPPSFLGELTAGDQARGVDAASRTLQQYTDDYDDTVKSPLAHPDDRGILSAITDPEKPVGWYMHRSNVYPAAYKMQNGSETPALLGGLLPSGESLGHAYGNAIATETHRQNTSSPVVGLPSDATPDQIRQRLAEIRRQQQLAQEPGARERYLRTNNYDPPEALKFASDLATDFLDPSAVVDAMSLAGLARKGIFKSARSAALELAPDVAVETGFQAAVGNTDVNYGSPEDPRYMKTPEELATANNIRTRNESVRLPAERQQTYDDVIGVARNRDIRRHGLFGGPRN
jgi:hypothetical protein